MNYFTIIGCKKVGSKSLPAKVSQFAAPAPPKNERR